MNIHIRATPLVDGPIIPPRPSDAHQNINGPSLLRVPQWIAGALAKYYLYFADHKGSHIELAYADTLEGSWTIHEGGALSLRNTPFLHEAPLIPDDIDAESLSAPRGPGVPSMLDDCVMPHIASPEVVVDDDARTVRLYYHGLDAFMQQVTRVAVSSDGLHFDAQDEVLGPPYLRVVRYGGYWYGLTMPGRLCRSRDGLTHFEQGPLLFEAGMRHAGLWLRGDTLWVFWTRVGDAPERILLSAIDLGGDWMQGNQSETIEVLRPTHGWEGANLPNEPSLRSSVDHPVNQLRDPYVYLEDDDVYPVYAVAGESGLAIARLDVQEAGAD